MKEGDVSGESQLQYGRWPSSKWCLISMIMLPLHPPDSDGQMINTRINRETCSIFYWTFWWLYSMAITTLDITPATSSRPRVTLEASLSLRSHSSSLRSLMSPTADKRPPMKPNTCATTLMLLLLLVMVWTMSIPMKTIRANSFNSLKSFPFQTCFFLPLLTRLYKGNMMKGTEELN